MGSWTGRVATLLAFTTLVFGLGACSDRAASDGGKKGEAAAAGGTPAASSVAGTAGCGLRDASLCSFAASLEAALQKGQGDAVAAAARPESVSCPDPAPAASDRLATVCQGHAGQKVDGYPLALGMGAAIPVARTDLVQRLATVAPAGLPDMADDYGAGGFRLFTAGAPLRAGCDACAVLVFSWVQLAPDRPDWLSRQVLALDVEQAGGSWQVTSTAIRAAAAADASATLAGGELDGRIYRWFHTGDNAPAGVSTIGTGVYFGLVAQVAGTGGDCANFRVAPGRAGQVTDCLQQGARVPVIGGPQEADGLRWWKVQSPNAALQPGWVAAQFLSATP
ncbi:MAG: SH3 domain-containing protein [Dehalococcoidia bacterium]|nr:SH3 domain-containing protein [Dehalococcoidia bacterium]